tara:strand:- start:209 stop:571 length:363 start_codon:yes stop_codon:yes gene_type:complete
MAGMPKRRRNRARRRRNGLRYEVDGKILGDFHTSDVDAVYESILDAMEWDTLAVYPGTEDYGDLYINGQVKLNSWTQHAGMTEAQAERAQIIENIVYALHDADFGYLDESDVKVRITDAF